MLSLATQAAASSQRRGDMGGRVPRFEGDVLGDEGVAPAGGVHQADEPVATEDRHGEVTVDPFGPGHVGLQPVAEAEEPFGPLPVPGEAVEGGDENGAAFHPPPECPERRLRSEGRLGPSFDFGREQCGPGERPFRLWSREAVVGGDVARRRDSEGRRPPPRRGVRGSLRR